VIATRRGRRGANMAGVVIVVALMGYALYEQHVVGLEVCPLCVLQRVAMISLGVVFLAAALHSARGAIARVYSVLGVAVALAGAGVSGWHVRLQHLPPDKVPSCGPGFDYMYENFPWRDMLSMIFHGSGECAKVNWTFLGLSMPGWVLIWFVALGALIAIANWHKLVR
jgi:protein dithiol:quinone oxidoreductase